MTSVAKATFNLSIPADPLLTAIQTAVVAQGTKIDALAAQVAATQAALTAVQVDVSAILATKGLSPPPSDWPIASPISGGVYPLTAGTKLASQHFDVPVVVKGAGMRATKIDGRGGIGSGFRLAWGKGVVHTSGAALRLEDLGFIRGGGGDGNSDGEAGFHAEGAAVAALLRCAFDGCENGVFVPPASAVALLVDGCVFGRASANGLADGRAHDMYVGGKSVTVRRSVFAGNSRGNIIKVRGPHLLAEDSWVGRGNGRWLDFPGGTDAVTGRNIFVTLPGAISNNAIGLYDEDDAAASPSPGSWLSEDDTFIFSRHTEIIWNNRPDTFRVSIIRPKVFWIGAPGATPPHVVYSSDAGGNMPIALPGNPFTPAAFTEANRLDAAPALPNDPV